MLTNPCQSCGKEVKQRYVSKYYENRWICSECRDDEKPDADDLETIQFEKELKEIIVTTTNTIEGKRIVQYLDVISVELIEGLSVFKDFGAGIADIFGGSATGYQKALNKMKEAAFIKLKEKAVNLGANAIIGIDLDYGDLRGSMLMLAVNGTAVIAE